MADGPLRLDENPEGVPYWWGWLFCSTRCGLRMPDSELHYISLQSPGDTLLPVPGSEGRIVERGCHEDLMVLSGLYRDFYECQSVDLASG